MLLSLLALHGLAAVLAVPLARRLGRGVFLACAVAPLAAVVAVAARSAEVLAGTPVVERLPWVPALGLVVDLRLDALALLMTAIVAGVGVLVFVYAWSYFAAPPGGLGRFTGSLTAFAGSMLGLVWADNVLVVFVFWELTSITSYLLIGFDDRARAARAAALQALLITGAGGLAMLGGLVLLGQAAGTFSLSGLLAAPPRGAAVDTGLVLVLLGAFTKSAQAPFHSWLPGAMAAPTPVSAYLHSATMVKAGVYLIARLAPAFATAPPWRPLVLTVGIATMLLGGWRALRQHDLKLLLAYGTVSQLGFLVVLFGAGLPAATLAGTTLILAHALFKAPLFMAAGIVDHQAHTRDIRRLRGLHRPLRPTFVVAAIAAASMAGLPPLFGFIAKEAGYEAYLHGDLGTAGTVLLALLVVGSMLTFAYSARLLWGAFADKGPRDLAEPVVGPQVPPAGVVFVAPAALLSALTVLAGVAPGAVDALVVGGARALDPRVGDSHLALWHGWTPALLLSAVTVAGGLVLWTVRRPLAALQARLHPLYDAGQGYRDVVRGTLFVADKVTGFVQSGSLPLYLLIIMSTVLVGPGAALLTGETPVESLTLADRPLQVGVAVLMVAATLGAVVSQRRIAAVLCLGAVGYGIAVLFVIQGAPDLALAQLLIETLTLVVFVLVLRHLPKGFRKPRLVMAQLPRVLLSAAVGVFVAALTVVAVSARVDPSVSAEYLARSLPEGEGRNVVNVIIVDFRGLDTVGEITVLTAAALGVIGLVRATRRERLRAGGLLAQRLVLFPPSLILDIGVRTVFHTLLLFSVFLLLAGHNAPGGGFVGGLVAGAAFVLVYVSGGRRRLARRRQALPEWLLGSGLTLAVVTGALGWLRGGQYLRRVVFFDVDVPVLGELKLASPLPFDFGVYLVVVGVVLALLRSLGREEVRTT